MTQDGKDTSHSKLVKFLSLVTVSVVKKVQSANQDHGLNGQENDQSGGRGTGDLWTRRKASWCPGASCESVGECAKLSANNIHVFTDFIQQLLEQVQLLTARVLTANSLLRGRVRCGVLDQYFDFTRILQYLSLYI